ncbi:MAG: SH3 domain-containing protein [Clostridia bacterium]|nr:SH3 domain-containing protein [Clostridia bacterium]
MKKLCLFLLFLIGIWRTALCEGSAVSVVAKVTTAKGSLNMRASASQSSKAIAKVPNGTCMLVVGSEDGWCLCEWNGRTGYCSADYLTLLKNADPVLLTYRVLRSGDKGSDVLALKLRLQELGYLRSGSALSDSYNAVLAEQIRLFQRQIGVTEDGIASQELQFYLFSDKAPACTLELPKARSQVKSESNGLSREICGCCMGEGCECCDYQGWIYY